MNEIPVEDPTRYGLTEEQARAFNGYGVGHPSDQLHDLADELGLPIPCGLDNYRDERKWLRDRLWERLASRAR